MRQKPESFDAPLSVLREKGWEIKRGKRMSARAPGQVRFKRLDSLGEGYSEKVLRAALDEKREWKPKERRKGQKPQIEHASVSLLVDVQAKLQQSSAMNACYAARECGAQILLFGHTHRPLVDWDGTLWVMNPGSIRDRRTYGVITLEGGKIDCAAQTLTL